ncbi:MAG: PP2C family protein-serine/threonine phosphatase [Cytophagales bacterium]
MLHFIFLIDIFFNFSSFKKLFEGNNWLIFLNISFGIGLISYLVYQSIVHYINFNKRRINGLSSESSSELTDKNEEILAQREEIERQQAKVKEVLDELTDSIKTAQRIQQSFLPPDAQINKYLPDHFVLYLPKDIVSGDFYWFHVKYDKIYIAAVDCTGHGVAGAFMSIIGGNLLKQIVIENPTHNAAEILQDLSTDLIRTLHQDSENAISNDGMDMSLCIIDIDENIIHFAGANNPLYIIRNTELVQIQCDKRSIGLQKNLRPFEFNNHVMEILQGDKYYMFSDGFASQFGGVNGGEKLKFNRFREILLKTAHLPFLQQRTAIYAELKLWQNTTEQTDDIMLIGFSVPLNEEEW